jgi:hypothetical protein
VPSGQDKQLVLPLFGAYNPAEQKVHTGAPSAENVPGEHALHDSAPNVGLYEPAVQFMHLSLFTPVPAI